MASPYGKPSRAGLMCENVDDPCCKKSEDKKPCDDDCKKPSSAVEHWAFFNMPFLQGDQEAKILASLYELQFKFDYIEALVVGRVLNKVEKVTHALYVRFPTVDMLKDYYKSEALSKVICMMLPHVHGEISIDYVSAAGNLDTNCKDPVCATVTLLRRKRDICPWEMDCSLHTLKTAADELRLLKDFTFGANVFICGDKYFTHAFSGFASSVCELDKLAENPHYSKLLHHKVLPYSCSTISVSVLAFKPIKSCL